MRVIRDLILLLPLQGYNTFHQSTWSMQQTSYALQLNLVKISSFFTTKVFQTSLQQWRHAA